MGRIKYIKFFKWPKASSYRRVAAGNATSFPVICCLISFCLPGSCCRNFNLSGGLFTQGKCACWDLSCRMQAESNCVRHADIELVECLEQILASVLFFFPFLFFSFFFFLFCLVFFFVLLCFVLFVFVVWNRLFSYEGKTGVCIGNCLQEGTEWGEHNMGHKRGVHIETEKYPSYFYLVF